MSNTSQRRGDATTVQSVDRAVTVLEILAREGEAGVTEIAAELSVHKSTAFRLVAALENRDLVAQDTQRGKYRLGMGILRLAGATTMRLDLVQQSRPVCHELAKQVGETVNVTVLAGPEVLYLDQVAGPSVLQPSNWVGQRLPLHATSNGKVQLAFLAEADRGKLLAAAPLARFTEATITDLGELERDLQRVRERGYATAVDEMEFGLTAIAAPVRGIEGSVSGSISVSGPSFRLPGSRLSEVARAVCAAADEVSRRLGWTGLMSA